MEQQIEMEALQNRFEEQVKEVEARHREKNNRLRADLQLKATTEVKLLHVVMLYLSYRLAS